MRGGAGVALVAVGIILLWMAITGKLDCLTTFVSCVFGTAQGTAATNQTATDTATDFVKSNLPGIIDFTGGLLGGNQPQGTPTLALHR